MAKFRIGEKVSMMQLKNYRIAILIFLGFAQVTTAQVVVPVFDIELATLIGVQTKLVTNGLNANGSQVSTAVANSQKAITEIINQVAETDIDTQAKRYLMEEKRINAETYGRNYGGRVKPACGVYKRSKSMTIGQASKKDIYKSTQKITSNHLERNRYASPTEPVLSSSANKIFAQFKEIDDYVKARNEKDKGSLIDPAFSGLSTKPNAKGNSEYSLEVARKNYIISPFPDRLPSNYDEVKQPAASVIPNAVAKIKIERLKEASTKINRILSNRATVYDDSWANSWYSAGADGINMKALTFGKDGAQGWYSTLETANRYRIMNPDWIQYTSATAKELALSRDSNLMTAQVLATLQEMLILLADISETSAQHYALDVENYGRDDSLSILRKQ